MEIECTIMAVDSGEKLLRNSFVVYRPQSHTMEDFVPDFEDLLQFLRNPKHGTILFGDFNFHTIKESKGWSDYENLLTAYCFKR